MAYSKLIILLKSIYYGLETVIPELKMIKVTQFKNFV